MRLNVTVAEAFRAIDAGTVPTVSPLTGPTANADDPAGCRTFWITHVMVVPAGHGTGPLFVTLIWSCVALKMTPRNDAPGHTVAAACGAAATAATSGTDHAAPRATPRRVTASVIDPSPITHPPLQTPPAPRTSPPHRTVAGTTLTV